MVLPTTLKPLTSNIQLKHTIKQQTKAGNQTHQQIRKTDKFKQAATNSH